MELLLILPHKILLSFKFKSNLIGDIVADGANEKKRCKNSCTTKILSNFWISLEMPLVNCCKVELSWKWHENCILSSAGTAVTFAITDTKRYVPIVTLSAENNVKLSKILGKGFKRSIYWNKYKVI